MSLQVNFALSDGLRDAISSLRDSNDFRCVIAAISKESVDLIEAIPKSGDGAADLGRLKLRLRDVEAAFVIFHHGHLTMVTYTPESLKPRTKMMYAASSSHVRQEFRINGDLHIASIDEISPSMFDVKANDKVVLATESELVQRRIHEQQAAELAVAPQRVVVMHGVGTPMTDAAKQGIHGVASAKSGCVLTVSAQGVELIAESEGTAADVIALLPADSPSFAFLRWVGDRFVFLYVCPEECKPKLRMQFAAAKPSVLAHLKSIGVTLARSVETSSRESAEQSIHESLSASAPDEPRAAAAPAARTMAKGPRMFMPE